MKEDFTVLKALNTVFFVLMVLVNALANILPIGGVNTGQVSDSYPNLFAPAGITFTVWGVIYVLLALFILYQWGAFKGKSGAGMEAALRIGPYFILSSAANIAWIFSWHYNIIPLSLALMIVILVTLIRAYQKINAGALSFKEKIFVRLPFSIYFGWITVATIANVTTLLVYLGWGGFGIGELRLDHHCPGAGTGDRRSGAAAVQGLCVWGRAALGVFRDPFQAYLIGGLCGQVSAGDFYGGPVFGTDPRFDGHGGGTRQKRPDIMATRSERVFLLRPGSFCLKEPGRDY